MGQSLGVLAGVLGGLEGPADPREADWQKIDADEAVRIRRVLAGRYAASTVNKMLAALRGVMRACRDQGLIDEAGYQAVARLNAVKGPESKPSRALTEQQVCSLFKACASDKSAAGRRTAALLAVFLCTGLRREEATELNAEDLDVSGQRLHIRSSIQERDRWVSLPAGACRALDDWLAARGSHPGPLLNPVDKSGRVRDRRLTDQALYLILRSVGEQTGVGPVSTRDLRSTLIVRLIRADMDFETISKHVGYLSFFSVRAYEDLAEGIKGQLGGAWDLPYPPKGKGGMK